MAHLYVVPTCALCREPRSKSSMAIYHLSASIVKRSAGRSVIAAAAYRAAAKIEDITTGLVHDYTRKKGVDYSEILSPISASLGNEWLIDRQELWNKIEEVERRKDAQLAREITLAIPRELSRPEQIALVREYVQTNYVAAGMVADVNLHHLDGDNPHAHILLTMRNLQTTPEGIVKFGLKNTDWNSKDLLLTHRKSWEEITNKYLANYGSDIKIDCRSLKEQGSEFIPQIHVGVHAMAMHRQGKQTDRREEFDRIEAENNDIRANLEQIYREEVAPESEPEPEPELGKLVDNLIPLNCKNSLKLGEYRVQRGYKDYIQVSTNLYGTKILELTRENDRWSTNIVNPNNSRHTKKYYSPDYISELVNDFERCVRYPTESESQKFNNEINNRYNPELGQIGYYPVPKPYSKNEDEHKLGKLLNELLEKWGQRIFHPEDIKLVFYKIQPDQISVYIDGHKPQCTRVCSFKFIDDRWINTVQPKDDRYSIDNLITMVSDQHHRFDTGEIKKFELTDLERREISSFSDWCGLELNDSRLATIRERGKEIISNDLANDLVKWIDKNIPRTSEILTKDRIKEILADSSQPVIIIHNDRSNSVYTDYHLIDTLENKSLEIRHNRNRLEMISGVVTPLIAEQIKIITNELENPEEVTSDINRQISTPTSPPKVQSGDVVNQVNLILQTLANQVEEKLEEPDKIEPRPQMKEPKIIGSISAIKEFEPIIVESDRIIEDEQPIKIVKTHQPRTIKRTRRQPDRGGR
jgi:MobA/MobL family